jgi:hypothetical protein
MTTLPFTQLDVFTATPLLGNPLAVVHGADALDDARMQAFARWTNLSETTFLLRPTDPRADYRVRIFTTVRELPFAGHPTLGSCHAWLQQGGRPRSAEIVQECAAGLIRIRRDDDRLAFAAPPLRRSGALEPELLAQIARSLRIDAGAIRASQWVDNGPGWVAVMLGSRAEVLALAPDFTAMRGLELGVVGPWHRSAGAGAIRGPRLHLLARRPRGSGHRQPECGPGAVADRCRPGAAALRREPGHGAGPCRQGPCRPHRRRHLDRWPDGGVHRRTGDAVTRRPARIGWRAPHARINDSSRQEIDFVQP